jgi:hypothetical protein
VPRVCLACVHPERDAIDKALASGAVVSQTAALYRVSPDALARHKVNHLPESMVKAAEQADVDHGIDLHKQLKAANALAWQVAKEARDAHDGELALKACDRILRQLELVAELAEAIDRRPQINVLLSPEWVRVRSVLVEALRPFPEARSVVSANLVALEDGHARGD